MPYVKYHAIVNEFVKVVYNFNYVHPEYNLICYEDILNEEKIKWDKKSMESAIVDDLDIKTVLALIMGIVRADRYCEGVIKSMLENGTIRVYIEYITKLKVFTTNKIRKY